MLVGEVFGKTGTKSFHFRAYKEVNRMDFVTVKSADDNWLLCRVEDVEMHPDGKMVCKARIIGYRENGILKIPKVPIKPNSLVYKADRKIISEVLNLKKDGLYIGVLEANEDVKVFLDPQELISKHVAVLAATGSGKSYTVGVLLEEIAERRIPVVVIDPHGEYISMRFPNDVKDAEAFRKFGIQPKGYEVQHYSPDPRVNPGAMQLSFGYDEIDPREIGMLFPSKPTASQLALLYAAFKRVKSTKKKYTLEDVIAEIEQSQSQSKWNVINMLEMLKDMKIFSEEATPVTKLVVPGKITVINLRGVSQEVQAYVVYKIVEKIFEARKIGMINPCFLVIEEAHNFIPQSEAKISAKIIKNVASEGRKFGLGLCVISQRPARIDKNVLSQCNTQIILRMMNPNDLKAVSYAEGLSAELEKEIKNLNTGTALIIGQEFPIIVKIRVRRSKHGGVTQDVTEQRENEIPVFLPLKPVSAVPAGSKVYYPCWVFNVAGKRYVMDAVQGKFLFFDGNVVREQNGNGSIAEMSIEYGMEEIAGRVIKAEISHEQAAQLARRLLGKVDSVQLVYYPYVIADEELVDLVTGARKKIGK